MCQAFGLWDEKTELPNRGLFLIDPDGKIQYAVVHGLSVGRSVDEVLRVLDALQSGGLCPAGWTSTDGTIDVASMLKPGRVLGHYRIERELGRGAFGSVFASWDLKLERRVAVKVLRGDSARARDDLLAEARAAAAISHPNVCTVYAVEEVDGLPLIVMEYLEGRPLTDWIESGLDLQKAQRLLLGIARGLQAAHHQGVTHRDLKPANVLVVDGERPVVVDFGLVAVQKRDPPPTSEPPPSDLEATVAASAEVPSSPPSFAISGTPAYMSPEHLRGEVLHPPSDIFSLGLIFVEMVTAKRALAGESILEILQSLQDERIGERLAARLPEASRDLAQRILSYNPEERPTADEIVEELESTVTSAE